MISNTTRANTQRDKLKKKLTGRVIQGDRRSETCYVFMVGLHTPKDTIITNLDLLISNFRHEDFFIGGMTVTELTKRMECNDVISKRLGRFTNSELLHMIDFMRSGFYSRGTKNYAEVTLDLESSSIKTERCNSLVVYAKGIFANHLM